MNGKIWLLPCLAVALACPLPAPAQKYPDKPIRLVVAFPTGSPYILALLLSEKLREPLGQPVVPDFRGGAGGNLAAEIVAKAPADGYTLLLTSATIVISPSLFPKLGYDTFRDFAPVTLLATVPNVPTTAEAGMPELVVITWYGLFAPAGVKPDIIERLNSEFVSAMNAPDTRGKLAKMELDVATSTPAETARFVRAEFERWARVIREAGIKPAQ